MILFSTLTFLMLISDNTTENHPTQNGRQIKCTYDNSVLSKEAAIDIATKFIADRYDNQTAEDGKPYSAELINQLWVVKGFKPEDYLGGYFIVYVNAHTGCVVAVNPNR